MGTKAQITAENQFSDTIIIPAGKFNLSIWGTFNAVVTVQRSFDNEVSWLDCDTFNIPGEWVGEEGEGSRYRIGVKTGDFVSGTINIRVGI